MTERLDEFQSVLQFGLRYFQSEKYELSMGKTHLICLHGYLASPSTFSHLAKKLQFRYNVVCLQMPTTSWSVAKMANWVEVFLIRRGITQYSLVGHSLGGIVALYHQLFVGKNPAQLVLCLSAPLAGSPVARFAIGPVQKELRPGSELLLAINNNLSKISTRVTLVQAEDDLVVFPYSNHFPNSIIIPNCGHLGILTHPKVLEVLDQ